MALKSYINSTNQALVVSAWGSNQVHANPTTHVAVGTSAADTLYDDGAAAKLTGGAGDDTYYVASGATVVVEAAGGGNDTIVAYDSYHLPDFVENLTVGGRLTTGWGNDLDNLIDITGPKNLVYGGKGNDVLINSSVAGERFGFNIGDGKDTIVGFKTGAAHDFVLLNGFAFTDFASVKAAMTQVGSDVLLKTSATDSILFRDHLVADFTASDFGLGLDTSKLKLTFNEGFDSLSLWSASNPTGVWKTNFIHGLQDSTVGGWDSRTLTPNHELQLYVDPSLTGTGKTPLGVNPFSIDNGVLTITAAKTAPSLEAKLWGYDYTSGLLTTEKSFAQKYGYFEIRADIPTGQGVWPAFWLLPADQHRTAEIDVMENVNGDDEVHQTVHTGQSGSAVADGFATTVKDLATGFHTYGMMWTAETITWYIDGKAVASIATPADMHTEMYMLVNLAIGGDWAAAPDASFTSAQYKIDYVKAYSLTSGSVTPTPAPAPSAPAASLPAFYTAASAADKAPAGYDSVHSAYSFALNATAHELVLTGASAVTGTGNALDNIITGNDAGGKLVGGAGNDVLTGGLGADYLDGGAGVDQLIGGFGDDRYIVDAVKDVVIEKAGAGYDTIESSVTYTLPANVEALLLTGTANIDGIGIGSDGGVKITGNSGANHLWGGAGDDILDGGKGADILEGGAGNDTYYVDSGSDKVVEAVGGGVDTVMSGVTYTLSANVENLTLINGGDAAGYGNELANTLLGNSGANKLYGLAGDDVINGGAGKDTIDGGLGADRLTGGADADTFVFGRQSGIDVVTDFGNGMDAIDISAYLKAGVKAQLIDSAAGLTIKLGYNDAIVLDHVHLGDLTATSTGYVLSADGVHHLMGLAGDHYLF
jgi:beta-glucanase (GH16 family)/Ca2+-binding RTX toxin-like protein